MSPKISLKFFPANHAWAFTFGDALLRMGDSPLLFGDVHKARSAAADRGIWVAEDGLCFAKSAQFDWTAHVDNAS